MANSMEGEVMCVKHSVLRASSWAFCAPTAIYTAKLLMITFNYHYPATIVSRLFGVLLFGYILALFVAVKVRDSRRIPCFILRSPEWAQLSPSRTWLYMIPAAVGAAVSLPMLFKGIFYMENLATFVMLSPMMFAAEWAISSAFASSSRQSQGISRIWWALLIVAASVTILYHERRLNKRALIYGVASTLSIGITKAFMDIGFRKVDNIYGSAGTSQSRHGFIPMSLTFGFILTSLGAALHEQSLSWHEVSTPTYLLSLLNVLCSVGAVLVGSSPLMYHPMLHIDADTTRPETTPQISHTLISSTPVLFILLATASLHPEVIITWTQIFAYLFSAICAIELSDGSISGASQTSYKYLQKRSPSFWDSSNVIRGSIMLVPCYLALALIFIKSTITTDLAPSTHHPTLDRAYVPTSRFDIVVSMYREEPSSVKSILSSIKNTKMLRTLNPPPRTILYTKDPSANITSLLLSTGADLVLPLENRGREGATYLSHITTRWDDLAAQTLFIQAQVHDLYEVLAQMDGHLVPETGMLSFGITGETCDCLSCADTHDWGDSWSLVPHLYSTIYNRTCAPQTPILLTYAGQFVASGKRIRGVDKSVYKELLDALVSEEGWGHEPDILEHEELVDKVTAPVFGYSVEKVWGVLMQCAEEERIARRCPSLMSVRWVVGEVGDCQCLDSG